jgi:hypothetical protein
LDSGTVSRPYHRWSPAAASLVLPLQFDYSSLFGDVLQLTLAYLELRLKAESIKFPVRHGGVVV